MNIGDFHYLRGFYTFEGYSQQISEQVNDLVKLTQNSVQVMEIGFNAGHSADVFLKNNSSMALTSFDLGIHDYVLHAKEYIDTTYPNRHTLLLGDSTVTVPKYISENPDKRFDVIFIDGGHEYEVATADLNNCMKMAHKDTIVILDDTIFNKELEQDYSKGPTQAWLDFVSDGKITEIQRAYYHSGRGMAWGKYVV